MHETRNGVQLTWVSDSTLCVQEGDDQEDMNLFLAAPQLLNHTKAREVLKIEDNTDAVVQMTCTSELYYKTGNVSVEMLMVLEHLGLVNLGMLSQSVTGRRNAGRQALTNWAGTTRTQRNATLYLNKMKKNLPGSMLHFLGYRVVFLYEDTETVGVVQSYNSRTKQYKIFFQQYVGTEESPYEHVDVATLAVALNKAKEANLSGPPARPIIEA